MEGEIPIRCDACTKVIGHVTEVTEDEQGLVISGEMTTEGHAPGCPILEALTKNNTTGLSIEDFETNPQKRLVDAKTMMASIPHLGRFIKMPIEKED